MEHMFRRHKIKEACSQIATWEAYEARVRLPEGGRVQYHVGDEPPLLKIIPATSTCPARWQQSMNWPSLWVCVKGHQLSSHLWVDLGNRPQSWVLPAVSRSGEETRQITSLGSCSQGYALAWALFSRKHFHNENTDIGNKSITVFLTTRYVTGPAIGALLICPPSFLSTIPCNRHHYPILHERKLNYFPHIQVKNRTQILFIKEYAVITYLSFLLWKCQGLNKWSHTWQSGDFFSLGCRALLCHAPPNV